MEHLKTILESLTDDLAKMAEGNAVVATPISVNDRHVVPLVELTMALGGAGVSGRGEGASSKSEQGAGAGNASGAGGGAKANPVALLVVEQGKVRLEKIGD